MLSKRLDNLLEPVPVLPAAVGAVGDGAKGSLEAAAAAQHPQGHRRLSHTHSVYILLALTILQNVDISWQFYKSL
jgi:hypothetical protein